MKKLILIIIIFVSAQIKAQEKLDLDLSNSCSFNGAPIRGEIYGFTSSNEAINIIDEIVGHIGLKRNFKIQAGNVPNAAATIKPGYNGEYDRYILYSQSFMSHIINESNSYWAAIGIMAHEVAHHLNGHTLKGPSRPPTELEADEFAGFVLYKMGATLQQAQSMFKNKSMYQPYDSKTHPATSARLEAVAVGYQKSKEKSGKIKVSDLPNNRTTNTQSRNTSTDYPNTNRTTNFPNTTTTTRNEKLTSEDVQYVSANINGQNVEFQILKDKRLMMVTSKTISNNGDQNVNVSLAGNFIPYNYQGQNYYSVYFGALDPTYGTTSYYTFFVYSNGEIYISPYNNPQSTTRVGNLKFNWGFSSSSNNQTTDRYTRNSSSTQRQIYFKNNCGYNVQLALRYRYDNNNWKTVSWYSFNAYQGDHLNNSSGTRLFSNNSIVYFYAEIPGEDYSWTGKNSKIIDGEYYDMREHTMKVDSYGNYYISIDCSNKGN